MGEARSAKYGRFLAYFVRSALDEKDYACFLSEIKRYSDEPRREGEARNSGCVNELEEISEIDCSNPKHVARLVKEGLHLMYQKRTSKRALDAFLKAFR